MLKGSKPAKPKKDAPTPAPVVAQKVDTDVSIIVGGGTIWNSGKELLPGETVKVAKELAERWVAAGVARVA